MTTNTDTEKKILKLSRDIKRIEAKINNIEEQFKKFTKIVTFNNNKLKNEIANKQGSV